MPLSKPTRNFLALFLGTVTVILGTVFLLASAIGWQYDFATGELRETGLILMNSEPANAEIRVDNTLLPSKTPYRYTSVRPGRYEVRYNLEGFRPWIKQVSVAAERVSFADYAWMTPEDIPTRQRYITQAFTNGWQSYDRRRFIFLDQTSASTEPSLYTSTDLSRPPVLLYTPSLNPAVSSNGGAISASPVTKLESLSFSADSSQALVYQVHADGSAEWIIIPASQSDTPRVISLNSELAGAPTWVAWGPSGNNDLYVVLNQTLRRFTLNDRKSSNVLATNIWTAKWSDQTLVTIEGTSDQRRLVARNRDIEDAQTLLDVPASATYDLEYFKLLDNDYIALLVGDTQTLTVTKGIFANKAERTTSTSGTHITHFTVNRSGRYLVYNQKDRFVTIDIEQNQRYRFNASLAGLTTWEWMNDQHLAVITGNQIRIIDYDGQNNELIDDTINNPTSLLFAENKSLLGFVQPPNGRPTQLTHFFLNPERIIE